MDDRRPKGPLVWIHCPDPERIGVVGALARRLEEEGDNLNLVLTAADRMRANVPSSLHQMPPLPDTRSAAKAFMTQWRPDLMLWMYGAVQPTLLTEIVGAGTPALLIDAEVEAAGIAGGGWRPGARRAALRQFERTLAVDGTAAAKLRRAGVADDRIEITGRLDEDHPLPHCHESDRSDMARAIGSRPVWLAAGAVPQELAAMAAAQRQASKRAHRLLLLVAPSQVKDAGPMAESFKAEGFVVACRGDGEEPDEATEIYIADGVGEIGLWYRLAPMTMMGGTLTGLPSRDPFEPASLGSAVLHGLKPVQHLRSYDRLAAAGACRGVRSPADLGLAVEALLSPDRAAALARAAWDVASEGAEASNRVIDLIRDYLERPR